jgi:hypothetical protein
MPAIARIRVNLSGFQGAPGLNTWFGLATGEDEPTGSEVAEFSDQIRAMYNSLKAYLANGVTAVPVDQVDIFEVSNGNLVGRLSVGPTWSIASTDASSPVSRATQAKLRLTTNQIVGNRILQGGPFFGPLGDSALGGDGSLATAFRTAVPGAFGGMLDVIGMRSAVWSQPGPGNDGVGEFGYVQSVSVGTLPAVLRSRRD